MRPISLFAFSVAAVVAAGSNAVAGGPIDGAVLRGAVYEGPAVQPRIVPGYPIRHRFEGFYIGGQVGAANSGVNFTHGVADLVARILRNTTVENEFNPSQWVSLPRQAVTRASYGGFVGYNMQLDEIIYGFEVNYSRTDIRMTSGDSIGRTVNTSDGYANDVLLSGTASIHLTDYATFRARAGWDNDGFIPYGFLALAVGRATVTRQATVAISGVDADPGCVGPPNVCLPPYATATSLSDSKVGAFGYGWALGGGFDWVVLPNVFWRGEYEFINFPDFYGARVNLHTVRTAIGFKF